MATDLQVIEDVAVSEVLDRAWQLQAGLKAWYTADRYLRDKAPTENSKLRKAFRDNWDARIGAEKFGGVWSIGQAKTNLRHPASEKALGIAREHWSGRVVTVDHAIPVSILFAPFWHADTPDAMRAVIDAYVVAVITKDENDRLNAAGLRQAMPAGWRFGDNSRARWEAVGIEVPDVGDPA